MDLVRNSHIAYVNLDHRTDRRQHMETQLANMSWLGPVERVRGQYYEERDMSLDHTIPTLLSRPQKGAIGCFASQLKIMRRALELGKHAWVMEDDLDFCSDFKQRIEYMNAWQHGHGRITRDNRPWDIIWLGGTFHVNPPWWHRDDLGRDAELTDDPRMVRTYGSFCTYAYIVNVNSVAKVLSMLYEIMPQSIGIDWSMIQISPKLLTFAFVPGCTKQYDNLSDQIPEKRHTTEFSRFGLLNGTVENSRYWYQDRMEDFDPTTFDWAEARTR